MERVPHIDAEIDALLARSVEASRHVRAEDIRPAPDPAQEPVRADVPPPTRDELRRLTVMFSDFVGSTALSSRLDPETYRGVLAVYKDICRRVIEDELDGHLVHTRGDGLLAVFGYPTAHEDDALRAVKAGLEIHRQLAEAPVMAHGDAPVALAARIGVHRGLVYVERDTEELYGFAVNVAARVQEAAEPGTVAISDEVRRLVDSAVLTVPLESVVMKGVDVAPRLHRVLEEREHPAGSRRWSTPMVGRQADLDALAVRHADAARSGHPVGTLVVGDAGVGKTRLVSTFLDGLPRRTAVLELGASPFHRDQGLHPIREMIGEQAGLRRHRPAEEQLHTLRDHLERRDLGDLLALLAPVVGLPPEAGYEPVAADPRLLQTLIADAVHELLVHWVDGHPAVVLVEDVHWLDEATAGVIDRFIAAAPGGVLVLMTSRTPRILGGDRTSLLELGPLATDERLELALLHDASLPPAVAAEVADRSDGIPLFLEELVRSRDERLDPPPGASDTATDVPNALYEPLCARLNTMPEARLVVSAAATIGRTVNLDLLARVSRVSTLDLDRAVATLIDQQVVEPHHGDGRTVRFRHELVRQVAYELEPPSGRKHLHALVADALSSGEIDSVIDWSLIAAHHRQGGKIASAVEAFVRAAEDARQRGSLEEARTNFDRALETLAALGPSRDKDRQEVQLRLGRAFLAVSSEGFTSEQAAEDYRRSLELCLDDPASEELYQTLIALWGYYLSRSDLERAWMVSTALRGMTVGHREWMLPPNTAGFGMIAWYQGRFEEAARRLEESVADIRAIGADDRSAPATWTMPLDPIGSMHIHLALARFSIGDPNGAAEQARAVRERCSALPFPLGPFTTIYGLLLEASIEVDKGDVPAARDLVGEALELASRHGFDAWLFWASMMGQVLDAWLAPPDDVRAVVDEVTTSIGLWDAIGTRVLTGGLQVLVSRWLLSRGDLAGVSVAAAAVLATAEETGSVARVLDARRMVALAGPDDQRVAALIAVLDDAVAAGARACAVEIAADLVRSGGVEHLPRLEAALGPVPADADYPVLAAARSLTGR